MNTHWFRLRSFSVCNFRTTIYIILSMLGIFLGIVLSVCNSHLATKMDISVFCAMPTYSCLLAVNVIPIAVLACLLAFSLTTLCFPLVLHYSVSRGFTGMLFYLSYDNGACLIRFLLCFSGYTTTVLLWWLLLRNMNRIRTRLLKDTCLSLVVVCVVTVIDFKVIAPFLSSMFLQQ